MKSKERTIKSYVSQQGEAPFEAWVHSLQEKRARARILQRIDRLRLGNFGDCRSVGDGVYELRIHFGPGFRVYFGIIGSDVALLLCGGDKSSQKKDIARAYNYWKEFQHNAN